MNSPASEPNSMARALLLGLALGTTPAFAEEPTAPAPQPVQAATDQTAQQAKMTVISLCADAGGGSNTLDSATAAVQGGAAYGALDACADVHPLPFPGWNGLYLGGEANGRIGNGWGVSSAEGEVGYDFGRFGFDLGYGAYWDVLDGNRANTNVDGVPHASLDLYVRPFPVTSKVSPLTVDLSLGSQWPQGTYTHPAYWSLHLGVGGTWEVVKVNSPAPRVNESKAETVVNTSDGEDSRSVASVDPASEEVADVSIDTSGRFDVPELKLPGRSYLDANPAKNAEYILAADEFLKKPTEEKFGALVKKYGTLSPKVYEAGAELSRNASDWNGFFTRMMSAQKSFEEFFKEKFGLRSYSSSESAQILKQGSEFFDKAKDASSVEAYTALYQESEQIASSGILQSPEFYEGLSLLLTRLAIPLRDNSYGEDYQTNQWDVQRIAQKPLLDPATMYQQFQTRIQHLPSMYAYVSIEVDSNLRERGLINTNSFARDSLSFIQAIDEELKRTGKYEGYLQPADLSFGGKPLDIPTLDQTNGQGVKVVIED